MILREVTVEGRSVDVRIGDAVLEIGSALTGDEVVIDGAGGELLPGLHDHHIHVHALAAARTSLDLAAIGPASSVERALRQLADAIAKLPGDGWIRAFNYHENAFGQLDRHRLDELVDNRPMRVQHTTGKLWVLNSNACAELALAGRDDEGIERERDGRPTGRLFRADGWLRDALANEAPDLTSISRELAGYGITGLTDASFTNDANTRARFASVRASGEFLQRVVLMGSESLLRSCALDSTGPPVTHLKIMLDEDALPELAALVTRIRHAHEADFGVAFHCVTHLELVVALEALREAGTHAWDRIEHGAIIAPEMIEQLVSRAVGVATQPGFIADRGERYRRDHDAEELASLYRFASLLDAGVPVIASSDAPYGPVDPSRVIAAARTRLTDAGRVLTPGERVSFEAARSGYLADPLHPAWPVRRVVVGMDADLVLLAPGAKEDLAGEAVVKTIVNGRVVHDRVPTAG